MKINGIRSLDIKVKAVGFGVVNWNGTVAVMGPDGKELNNHLMPKLRGYTNRTGKVKEDTGYEYKKSAMDVDFSKTPMYISQNCIRHHMFREQADDLHYVNRENKKDKNSLSEKDPAKILLSLSGLIRGFVIPATQTKRKSPLLVEDFVEQLGNGNYEQFGNSGEKDENSIYSKTTFGETEYLAHMSLSIEDLQFISLDKKNDRAALEIKDFSEAEFIAEQLTALLAELDFSGERKPVATAGNYARIGSIYAEPECGILLNQDAIEILVENTLELIENLSIRQAKGWMAVDSMDVDYNDSGRMMRIKTSPESINDEADSAYAVYYEAV
ncbi:type I-Fv CRISPR-associated protein Cas7fv [Neptuniibacter sp. QD37_11]|uniref:type I-Fv CRISPR-associated protein Cas7fv n=1 Tax=Neptuniibacter sp. QD37_11 TaxID=3398209 RepID=UPI0039F4FC43